MNRSKRLKSYALGLSLAVTGLAALAAVGPVAAAESRLHTATAGVAAAATTQTVDPAAFFAGACRANGGAVICSR